MMDAFKKRVMSMVGRCIIMAVDDSRKIQSVQVEVLADELHDEAERFQHYGFSTHPIPGAEGIIVRIGGTASHGVIIVVDDRRYRLTDLAQGEVALYDDLGQVIHLKRDGILIKSEMKVRVEAERVDVIADTVNLGGDGGMGVARIGDSVSGGVITGGSTKVFAS